LSRVALHFSEMATPPHGVPQGLPTRGWAGEDLRLAATIIVEHSTCHWPGIMVFSKTLVGSDIATSRRSN
jgi:hypothetical protein